ncbi:MAG: AAA family ATPase [Pseudomonadota bacterium]
MSIVTFYSYKGGVGRSLAVANVAVQLAQAGQKVLVVDWDLEAPGLEEYFEEFKIDADGLGLLFLLRDQDNFKNHVWHLSSTTDGTSFDFLPSGRDEAEYYPALEKFSQAEFFAEGGGDFLEELRTEWNSHYDYVLIDSRTGLSDAGGVCTIQLPDIVVGMFTATRQSFRGVRDVLELALSSRQNLAYTRSQFSIIPVPCRLNVSDRGEVGKWMIEFAEAMEGLTEDWRPRDLTIEDVLWSLRVEHGRTLLHGTNIIKGEILETHPQAHKAFARLAELIMSNLADLEMLREDASPILKSNRNTKFQSILLEIVRLVRLAVRVLLGVDQEKKNTRGQRKTVPDILLSDFKYDVFLQVAGGSIDSRWVEEFFYDLFREHLRNLLGRKPRIFFERRELSFNTSWESEIKTSLLSSAAMIAFTSARHGRSEFSQREIELFMEHGKRPIIPVRLSSAELPSNLNKFQAVDFQDYFVTGNSSKFRKNPDFWTPFSASTQALVNNLNELWEKRLSK